MKLLKKDYGECFVILLLIILGTYLHFSPSGEKKEDLMTKKIFLKERPFLRERGEEQQKYIRIIDANSSLRFDVTGCALTKAQTDLLLSLNEHDSLSVGIRKSKSLTERFNGEIEVLYISSSKYGPLLTLADLDDCKSKSGAIAPLLIAWVVLILIARIIDRHAKAKVQER